MRNILLWLALLVSFGAEAQLIGAGRRGGSGSGSMTEVDPVFTASPAGTISSSDKVNWTAAYTATSNGSFVTASGNQTGLSGSKTWTGFHLFSGQLQTAGIALGGSVGLNLFQTNSTTNTVFRVNADGNTHITSIGAAPANNGNKLTVDGTTLLNGLTTVGGDIAPANNGTQNIGNGASRFNLIYGNAFVNSTTVTQFGSTLTSGNIDFRQGGASQIVGGYFGTTGNSYDQAPGVRPPDNGYRRSIYGTLLTTGRADFTDTWANYQASFGRSSEAGRIAFNRSSDGTTQGTLGFESNASNNMVLTSNSGGSTLILNGAANLRINTANVQRLGFDNTGAATFSGVTNHADVANFSGTWANYQTNIGANNQGGRIAFTRGSDGQIAGRLGYTSATAIDMELIAQSAGSSLILGGGSNAILRTNSVNRLSINSTGEATFSNTVNATQYNISALNTAPASATATGTTGEIRITSGFIFVCIATNTWVRAALTTF